MKNLHLSIPQVVFLTNRNHGNNYRNWDLMNTKLGRYYNSIESYERFIHKHTHLIAVDIFLDYPYREKPTRQKEMFELKSPHKKLL